MTPISTTPIGDGATVAEVTAAVRDALRRVVDPCSIATGVPIPIEDMGLVREIRVEGRDVTVDLRTTSPFCMQIGNIRGRIAEVTRDLPSVGTVTVEVDDGNEWLPDMMAGEVRARLRRARPLPGPSRPLDADA